MIYILSAFLFIFTFGGDAGGEGGVTGKVELRDRCLTNNIFASNGENPFLVKNGKKGRHGFVKSSHGCQGNDITHIFCVKHNT